MNLIKKMLRDIRNNKVQFASVFFMSLLGIMIYSGIEGVWLGMSSNSSAFYDDTYAVNSWVYGAELQKEDLNSLKKIDGVEDGILSMQFDCAQVEDGENKYQLQVNTFSDNKINDSFIAEGHTLSNIDEDACWLDDNYAKAHNIKIGDKITLKYLTMEYDFTVEGTIISPEYVSYTGSKTTLNPDHNMYGYCYINEKGAKAFVGGISYNVAKLITKSRIQVTESDGNNINSLFKDVLTSGEQNEKEFDSEYQKSLGDKYIISYSRSNYQGTQAFTSQIVQLRSMSFMFSALFIILSLLSMQTTMKRLVETQRTQIGTLKALGFSRLQITLHYASYGFIISSVGAILGFIIGPKVITPVLIEVQKDFYTLPIWSGESSVISYLIIFVMIISCTLITILACRESARLVPAEAMRNKQIEVDENSSKKLANYLPFEWKWSVRYIQRNRVRTIIGVIGVAGCLILLMASIGLYDSLNFANIFLYGTQYTYTNKIVFDSEATEEVFDDVKNDLLQDYQEVEEQVIQIRTKDTVYPSTIMVIDEGYYVSFYKNIFNRDEQISLSDDQIIISSKLADKLGITKGQTVKIKLAGDTDYVNVDVTNIVYMPAPQGIVMSRECFEKLGYTFATNAMFTGVDDVEDIREMNGVSEVTSLDKQYESAESVLDSAMMIVILLIMAGIVLSVIILFNLGILNYTERMREYSTLKVLGFEDVEIKDIIMKDTVITSMLGLVVGLPLGFSFLKLYVGTVSTVSFDYYPHISWYYLLIVILATIICSFSINHVVVSKIKNLDMVEALKSVE